MQRLRAIWERITAEIKQHPMIAVGVVLTLILVYFAWRQSRGSGTGTTTDPLPIPTDGGGGGGSPPPPITGGGDGGGGTGPGPIDILPPPGDGGGGGGGNPVAQAVRRVATDIRSNWGALASPIIPGQRTATDIRSNWGALASVAPSSPAPAPVFNTAAKQEAIARFAEPQAPSAPALHIWTGAGAQRARNVT